MKPAEVIRRGVVRFDKSMIAPKYGSSELDDMRKRRLAAVLVFVVSPYLYFWGVRHVLNGNIAIGVANLLLVTSADVSYLLRRFLLRGLSLRRVIRINVALIWVVLFLLLPLSVEDRSELMWHFAFPLAAFFLLGRREGLVWVASQFVASVVFLLFPGLLGSPDVFSGYFKQGFIGAYVLVIAISYAFEASRERFQRESDRRRHEMEFEAAKLLEATERADEANRAKSDFLANMSHELRTPLNHVIGFTDIVAGGRLGELNDEQREYLQDVLASGRHLLDIINEILDLSKVEAGKLELEHRTVDVPALLESGTRLIRDTAELNGIVIETTTAGLPDALVGDERRLRQVLYNLLSNAVKYTRPGGSISLSATVLTKTEPDEPVNAAKATQWLAVGVADTGVGIKSSDLERVFEPFERVETDQNPRRQGTGLGLSLSRRLIELHGGRLWAESDGPGKGSVFRFTIPIEPSPAGN